MTERRGERAFTLIEILVVIAIIAILMGISLAVIRMAMMNAKKAAQKAQISNLKVAISMYDSTFGQYPPDTATAAGHLDPGYDLPAEILYYHLLTAFKRHPLKAHEVAAPRDGGPFYAEDAKFADTDGDGRREIIDVWGRPVMYDNLRDDAAGFTDCSHPAFGADPRGGKGMNFNSYDVWSLGPPGGAKKSDVIGNFSP